MARKRKLSFAQKLTTTAGSISALSLLSGTAGAAVVQVTGSPVTLSMAAAPGARVTWDVDGVGGAEFELWRQGSSTSSDAAAMVTATGAIQLGSGTSSAPMNGRGLVGPTGSQTDNVQALNNGFNVGPTLANGLVWGWNSSGGYSYRNIMQASSTSSAGGGPQPGGPDYWIGYDFNFDFNIGENVFGFRFDVAGSMHYGFAVVDLDTANGIVTIDRWAYETVADTAIEVQDISSAAVPEPSSLTLLALGAGGLATMRARQRKRLQAEQQA